MLGFDKEYKIKFDNIDEKILSNLLNYFKSLQWSDNLFLNIITTFRNFIEYCVDHKLITNYTLTESNWKKYGPKKKIGIRRYKQQFEIFTDEELTFLKGKREIETGWKKKVLDLILFQCYTSARYSDLIRVNKEYVRGNRIFMKTQKTGKDIIWDISPILKSILIDNDYNLHQYNSITTYGQAIKILLQSYLEEMPSLNTDTYEIQYRGGVECKKKVKRFRRFAPHTGRRTFISWALRNGIDVKTIQQYTGHVVSSTTLSYAQDDGKEKTISSLMDEKTS